MDISTHSIASLSESSFYYLTQLSHFVLLQFPMFGELVSLICASSIAKCVSGPKNEWMGTKQDSRQWVSHKS